MRGDSVAASLVRLARLDAGLTQAQLAERLGTTQSVVAAYETGRRQPTMPSLVRLLAAAGFDLRCRLEPLDDHDETVEAWDRSRPPAERGQREAEQALKAGGPL